MAHAVLLRRSPTELQIGLDPSVVVPHTYEPLLRALGSEGPLAHLRTAAARSGLTPDDVTELVDALDAVDLIRRRPAAADAAVRVVGCGPLGARTAHELATAGFERIYLVDLPGRPESTAPDRRRARVELLSASLRAAHPTLGVRRSRHVGEPEGDAVALTVVVADGPEPDRLVVDVLREQGAPHLLVRCAGDEAVVGPLVVPGTTSCVRCADLARRDADPRWPWLLEQLTRTVLPPDSLLLTWAGVTATVQAVAYVEAGRAETLGHTLELGRPEHTLRLRRWAPHPECRCRLGVQGDRQRAGADVRRG